MEWTAISASPSCIACSNSLRNNPLPPILLSVTSRMRSPFVVIGKSSVLTSGKVVVIRSAAYSACHSAKGEFRVAMMIFLFVISQYFFYRR